MRVDVYSRHDAYIGTIGEGQLLGFIWTDCLNGEDTVDIATTFPLKEGHRLVWKDRNGVPHEHVCQDPKGASASGLPIYTDTALNSICELFGDYIEDKRPYGYSFQRALEVCLEPTRWGVGTVDQPGTVSGGLTFYHTNCRTALNDILECGGELETSITVGANGVTGRRVSILKHRGWSDGHRRFSYGKDISGIKRIEHWGAITACYGYGKGVETDSGGYGRKLTFGDINGGLNYVSDSAALKLYGRPDGKGGFSHVFGKYENSQCDDARQLLEETSDYLEAHSEPGVSYEVDVVDLVAMGRSWEGVGVGDDVQIVDKSFSPTLRCEGRVTKLVVDVLGGTQGVTLGNVIEGMADILQNQQQQISGLQNHTANWDAAAGTTPAFLQQMMDKLNEQFNTAGMSYMHWSFENGFIFSSVPLDENGKPTRSGAKGIQLCSQGTRIASGTKSDGSFNWQTFATGDGVTANVINTGTINGGSNRWNLDTGELLFKQGSIRSANGLNVWDLSNNTFTTRNMNAANMSATGSLTSGSDTSFQVKVTGGHVRFYYKGFETIELVSVPIYESGARGGYIQACEGSTYLGFRAPKAYTALNQQEAGTQGLTRSIGVAGIRDYKPGSSWKLEDLTMMTIEFQNGFCLG